MKKRNIIRPDPSLMNNLMRFGFDCDEGWHPLIEECLDRIEKALEKHSKIEREVFEITQIKEKFGGLDIYVSHYYNDIVKILRACKDESYQTCEVCGKPGRLREHHRWLKTLCVKHFDEWINPYRYYKE